MVALQSLCLENTYNKTACDLPPLSVGTPVAVQDQATRKWSRYSAIIETGPAVITLLGSQVAKYGAETGWPLGTSHCSCTHGAHWPPWLPGTSSCSPDPTSPYHSCISWPRPKACAPTSCNPCSTPAPHEQRQVTSDVSPTVADLPRALPPLVTGGLVPTPPATGLEQTTNKWRTRQVHRATRLIEENLY